LEESVVTLSWWGGVVCICWS